jgi:hypothetical protein
MMMLAEPKARFLIRLLQRGGITLRTLYMPDLSLVAVAISATLTTLLRQLQAVPLPHRRLYVRETL